MPTVSKEIEVNEKVKLGGANPLFLIGGPCVIESDRHAFLMAERIRTVCLKLNLPFIFKASYDKANRSSLASFRGPGPEEGLKIFRTIRDSLRIPVTSDVHETRQVERAAEVLDIVQIPAFLCRQTDLIVAAAKTGKPVNIKKGQFMSPLDMGYVVEKVRSQGNEKAILTERGTFFGYNNLVFDIRSIPLMKGFGVPVVIDASHIVQKPGGEGESSGGEAQFIPLMARAGVVAGADGIFLEIHDDPSRAKSDKYNSLNLNKLEDILVSLMEIRKAVMKPDEARIDIPRV